MLSEILQIKTNSVRSHLYVESKNAKLLEECLLFEGKGVGEVLVERHKHKMTKFYGSNI